MVAGDRVRPASVDDAERITAIYNQGIQDRIATFETEERIVDAVRSWFAQPYPIVVVERLGEVIAWAAASQYRPRACYSGICEFSVYVDRANRGSGAGTLAMQGLIDAATEAGYHKLVSRVFVENSGSRRLLTSLGFREVGVYHRHGQLDGVWRDVVIVERLLDGPDDDGIALHAGMHVNVVKSHWNNVLPALSYSGTIVPCDWNDWIAVEAIWTLPDVDVGGVRFITGGRIIEYFPTFRRFNIFQVYAPSGEATGIYANVTAPLAITQDDAGEPVLTWEDHWLDVVKLPDRTIKVLDEDEYRASRIPETDPELARAIESALSELLAELRSGRWDV